MPFMETLTNILTSWQFWAIILGGAIFGVTLILKMGRAFGLKKQHLVWLGIGGLVFTSGIVGTLDIGAVAGKAGMNQISDMQVTTAVVSSCTVTENTQFDDLSDVRCTDAQVVDSAEEVNSTILTITRSGDLSATSIPVSVRLIGDGYSNENDGSDSVSYSILEQNTLDEPAIYLNDGGAATTSSPRGKTQLAFDEGVAQKTLGVQFSVDEQAHDALSQYSFKDVQVVVGNKAYTYRIHRMD